MQTDYSKITLELTLYAFFSITALLYLLGSCSTILFEIMHHPSCLSKSNY